MSHQSNVSSPAGSAVNAPNQNQPLSTGVASIPALVSSVPNGQGDAIMGEVAQSVVGSPGAGFHPANGSVFGSAGPAGFADESPLEVAHSAIETTTENLFKMGKRLAQKGISLEEFNAVLAQYELVARGLEVLTAGRDKIAQLQSSSSSAGRPQGSTRNAIVPTDLPLLQWTGNVFDQSKVIFSSVQECLDRFEDIVESYDQDLNAVWCRLLPRMLSPNQRSWFVSHLKPQANLPWSFARKTIVGKYGIQDAERQAQFTQALFNLRMGRDESVEAYTDRFHKIRREAGLEDSRVTAALYVNSLLPELSQHVSLGQAHLTADKRESTDQAANLARTLYGKVVLSKHLSLIHI